MLRHQRIDILLSTIIGKVAQMRKRRIEALVVKYPMEYDELLQLLEFHIRTKISRPESTSYKNLL